MACGSGQGIGYLAGIARNFEAGDYSEEILLIARRHYGGRIRLRQFDAQDMPFEDKSKDVIILFEAIYYLPDAERFVRECARVLRSNGKVLSASANKDLYDFNPSPHTYKYYGVVELNELFARHGFKTEFFGDTPVGKVSMRQRAFRPVKRLAVMLKIMPKTTGGKKWLKRIVFGELVKMPVEIGPPISRISRNEQKKENAKVYSGRYVEPERIPSEKANTSYKVIYCVASLDPQITQINADS